MMVDPAFVDTVRGDLTDAELALVDWDRIAEITRDAVLSQPPAARGVLLEGGALQDRLVFEMTPFEDGQSTILCDGQVLARFGWVDVLMMPLEPK